MITITETNEYKNLFFILKKKYHRAIKKYIDVYSRLSLILHRFELYVNKEQIILAIIFIYKPGIELRLEYDFVKDSFIDMGKQEK